MALRSKIVNVARLEVILQIMKLTAKLRNYDIKNDKLNIF